MNKINIEEYNNAIDYVLTFINKFPKHLIPKYIIHNGHIKNPGISDIDLVIVFDDDFVFSSQFLHLFSVEILNLKNKDVFFHHLPHILPSSAIKDLPSMTFNPAKELNFLKGKISFNQNNLNEYQNILNSFEQIHNRICMLVQFLFAKEKNINSLLLIGHSITHTLTSINNIGGNFDNDKFIYFQKIEDIRQKIMFGKKVNNYDYDSLCKGLIEEFFLFLNWINEYLDKKINLYFTKSNNAHHYDDNIFLINLNSNMNKPIYSKENNNILISGFSWQTKCIFENYFEKTNNFKTLFVDPKLKKEIGVRVKFIKKLSAFNFNNFNSAVGRTGFHPLVRNSRYYSVARKIN